MLVRDMFGTRSVPTSPKSLQLALINFLGGPIMHWRWLGEDKGSGCFVVCSRLRTIALPTSLLCSFLLHCTMIPLAWLARIVARARALAFASFSPTQLTLIWTEFRRWHLRSIIARLICFALDVTHCIIKTSLGEKKLKQRDLLLLGLSNDVSD